MYPANGAGFAAGPGVGASGYRLSVAPAIVSAPASAAALFVMLAHRGLARPVAVVTVFDFAPALMTIFKGVTTLQQLGETMPAMSLVRQHLTDGRTPPMLVVAGAKDTQVPVADTYLLLSSGKDPKYAWINPLGGHMGRDRSAWGDAVIYQKVVVPWLLPHLGISPNQEGHWAGPERYTQPARAWDHERDTRCGD